MRTTDEPSEVELREPSTYDDSTAHWSTSMSDVPGPYERIASTLKVAALAIGPAAMLWTVFSLIAFDSYLAEVHFGGALLWVTVVAGAGVVARWLTLGEGPFVFRAVTVPLIAAGLALVFQFAVLAVAGAGRSYSGIAVTVLSVGFLCLYWSLASTFLARDGETRRSRRQWKVRDLTISLFLFGLYGAALRWLIGWFDLSGENAETAFVTGIAAFGGIFLIAFGVDLVCRTAAKSRYRWAFAAIGCVASLGGGSWAASTLFVTSGFDSTPVMIVFATAIYVPLSATLAGLMEWRPLLPTLRRLDERLRSRTRNAAIRQREASPAPSSAQE